MSSYPTNKDNDVSLLKKLVENTKDIADGGGGGSGTSADTTYDNSTSGLTATDVQAAIDEAIDLIEERLVSIETSVTDGQVVVYNGNGGKSGKKASGTGVAQVVDGVLGTVTIGSGLDYTGTTLSATGGGGAVTSMAGVSVRRTSNYTSEENNDVIDFDTVEFDSSSGDFFTLGDPTKIGPIPASLNGKTIMLHGEAIWLSGATEGGRLYRELKIFKNGDTDNPVAVNQVAEASGGNIGVQCTSRQITVTTGDYFQLCARNGGATTATVVSQDDYSITFGFTVLAAVAGPAGPTGASADGVEFGHEVAYPQTFDGSNVIDGSSATPFVDVSAFNVKQVLNSRVLNLVTLGASKDHRVRVTLGTAKAGVFDVRVCFCAWINRWASNSDAWGEIRLSDASDVQIAKCRLFGHFLNAISTNCIGAKPGTGDPAIATNFDPYATPGTRITIRFTRDGSNVVRMYFGLGVAPLALAPLLDGAQVPLVATVTETLARVEFAIHTPAGPGATAQQNLYIDYVESV